MPETENPTNDNPDPRNGKRNGPNKVRAGRGYRKGNNNVRRNHGPVFKGETSEMNGNVFQCYGETTNKQQFIKIMEMLEYYIRTTMIFSKDIRPICITYEVPTIEEHKDLTDIEKASAVKKLLWETKVKTHFKHITEQEKNVAALHTVLWGQCSHTMKAKIQSLPDYDIKGALNCDMSWLLKEIKGVTHCFEGNHNVYISLDDARVNFYTHKQDDNENIYNYLKNFQALVEVLEHYRAIIGEDGPFLMEVDKLMTETMPVDNDTNYAVKYRLYSKKRAEVTKHCTITIAFLKRANRKYYGSLQSDLENQYSRGNDQYPTDLTASCNLLVNYRQTSYTPKVYRHGDKDIIGMAFLQNGKSATPGTNGKVHPGITCYTCSALEHYASQYPNKQNDEHGMQLLQLAEAKDSDQDDFSERIHFYTSGFCQQYHS